MVQLGLHWQPTFRCRPLQIPFARYNAADQVKTSTDHTIPDVLRALHIIPRETTPLPLEERPEEDLTAEELHQVIHLFKVGHSIICKKLG